jgi:hypothetical protein
VKEAAGFLWDAQQPNNDVLLSSSPAPFISPWLGIVLRRPAKLDKNSDCRPHRIFSLPFELKHERHVWLDPVTTGAPHNPSGFRRRPLDPVIRPAC